MKTKTSIFKVLDVKDAVFLATLKNKSHTTRITIDEAKEFSYHAENYFVCTDTESSHHRGVIGLKNLSTINKTAFIDHYGNLESEDMAAFVSFCFNRIGLYKLSVDVLSEDKEMIFLFRDLGFKVEVRKRRHTYFDGNYHTVLEMSILKNEYDDTVSAG